MQLINIWNSTSAWKVLSALKKNPKLAYRLHKYEKKVQAEAQVCEIQRNAILYEVSGASPGASVKLEPETPEFAEFVKKFTDFLQQESDLDFVGISLDELIEGLGAEQGNVLSENNIDLLEPFFQFPVPAAVQPEAVNQQ